MSEPKAWSCGVCGQPMSGWIPACVPCVTKATNPDPPEGLDAPSDVKPVNPDGRVRCRVSHVFREGAIGMPIVHLLTVAVDPAGVVIAKRAYDQPLVQLSEAAVHAHIGKLYDRAAETLRRELGLAETEWVVERDSP